MEGSNAQVRNRSSRRRRLAKASVLATLGLTLTASAAFGGLSDLAGTVRDHIYCKTVRDCVYDKPETKITSGPDRLTNDRTPTFSFTSDEKKVTFRCRVDREKFVPCLSPHTTRALRDGRHSFEVYAVDSDGLSDRSPASYHFIVDTGDPECGEIRGPSVTRDQTPVFNLRSNDPRAVFSYRLDRRGNFKRTDSKLDLRKLDRGTHVLEVRAEDRAGNVDRTPARKTFRVVKPKRR